MKLRLSPNDPKSFSSSHALLSFPLMIFSEQPKVTFDSFPADGRQWDGVLRGRGDGHAGAGL